MSTLDAPAPPLAISLPLSRRDRLRDGRGIVLAALALYFGVIVVLGPRAWVYFGVGGTPRFLDFRSLTTAWDCSQRGVDVLRDNPCSGGGPLNYPRITLLPRYLGLGSGDTTWLVVGLLAAFYATALRLMGRLGLRGALLWTALLLAPPVMLGVNRGNIDLDVFVVVSLSALALAKRGAAGRAVAHGGFLLAAMLKFYPAFAFAALLRQRRRWRLVAPAAVAVAFAAYIALTWHDVREINAGVPRNEDYSYGAIVLRDWLRVAATPHSSGVAHVVGSRAFVVVLIVLAALAGIALAALAPRVAGDEDAPAPEPATTLFVAGVAIYLGTWVTFVDYNYRLVFLLLTVPLLLHPSARRALPLPRAGVGLVVATLWLSAASPWTKLDSFVPLGWVMARWYYRVDIPPGLLLAWLLAAYYVACLVRLFPFARLEAVGFSGTKRAGLRRPS